MASPVWQSSANGISWTTITSIDLKAGSKSGTLRLYFDSTYTADKVSISAFDTSDISISLGSLVSNQYYTLTISASSNASGRYVVTGTTPGGSADLTVNVTRSEDSGGGSGGTGSVYWSKTSSGSAISSITVETGLTTAATVYLHMGGYYSEVVQISSDLYTSDDTASGEILPVSINTRGTSTGGYTLTGTTPAGSATLNVSVVNTSGGGSGGGSGSTATISGPSSITAVGAVTYTASGFTDTDSIEWSLTNTQYCDFESSSGPECTIMFNESPTSYTTMLTAQNATQSASKTISVSANIAYSGYRKSITIALDGSTWDNVRFSEDISQADAMLTCTGASHCSVEIKWITAGKIQVYYSGVSEGTDTVKFYNAAGYVWTTTVNVTNADFLTISGPSELSVGDTGEYTPSYKGTLQRFGLGVYNGCELDYTEEDELLTVTPISRSSDNAYFYVTGRTTGGAEASLKVSVTLPPLKLVLNAPTTAEMGRVLSVSAGLNLTGFTDTYSWTTSGVKCTILSTGDTLTLKPNASGTLTVSCESDTYGLSASVKITITEPTIVYVTLTYNANGGIAEVSSVEVIAGRSVILPDAQKESYVLEGWYTASTGGTRVGGTGDRYIVESATTLYAHWVDFQTISTDCYLSVYHDDIRDTMRFEVVDSIEDTITANLNSVSTIVFGAANRFIMDLGTSRKFTLNVSRANPANYSDSSPDQADWSNGKWLREFLNMIDFWQNFGRDPTTGKNTGGMRFHFAPTSDMREMYPSIDSNVFVVGTISPSYSGPQLMKLSIPLQVAGMDVSGAGIPTEFVTYTSTIAGMDSVEQEFVKGASISILSMPPEWTDFFDGRILVSWTGSDGKIYYPNESAKLKTGMTMTANWKNCWYRGSAEDSYWEVIADGRLMIYAVGGGGAGASCSAGLLTGGGGGAGRTRILTISVRKGDLIEWDLGAGGEPLEMVGGTSNGGDGGETVVTLNGLEILRAEGGKGGMEPKSNGNAGGPFTGYGGQGWGSGGTSNIPRWMKDGEYLLGVTKDVKGGDGSTVAPNIEANVGKGHLGGDTKNKLGHDTAWMGGSGGGASGLYVRFGATTYMSKGGDGGYISGDSITEFTAPGDGKLGGGGGSGVGTEGGSGGKGFVILAFYSA